MRSALAAACLLGSVSSLMFHSKAVSKQWDTWAFVENGTFYAYYLVTEVSYGEGFGVATSSDGVHFDDHGYVWHGPSWWNWPSKSAPKQFWEGSSAVWRAKVRGCLQFSMFDSALIMHALCPMHACRTSTAPGAI